VFFFSDRSGYFDIYRQSIDQQIAEPVVAGPRDKSGVIESPDGSWHYYAVQPEGWKSTITRAVTWMRIPSTGGPSQAVFDGPVTGGIACGLPPSHVCVLAEWKANEMIVSAIDPERGRGKELGRLKIGPRCFGLSPDGSRIVVPLEDQIRILDLRSGKTEDISYTGWKRFRNGSVKWAPDGKGLFATSSVPGRTVILHMDFEGHASPLFELQGEFDPSVLPSPDGRRLAFTVQTSVRNAWMIEKF
jgi:Tol biopolymer transport system component